MSIKLVCYENFDAQVVPLHSQTSGSSNQMENGSMYTKDMRLRVFEHRLVIRHQVIQITIYVKKANTSESHASLTLIRQTFSDFQMTLDMKTVKQLRQNMISPSAPWDTAWVFWHDTGAFHNYVLFLVNFDNVSITPLT